MRLPKEKIKLFLSKQNLILRESVMVLMKENYNYDNESVAQNLTMTVGMDYCVLNY
jgi:hypothetical protein